VTASRSRSPRRRPPDPRRRVVVLLAAFCLVGIALFGALADLQAVRPDQLRLLGEDQRMRTVPIEGFRGSVIDRSGFVLAMSARSHRVVVDPTMLADPPATAAVLAPVLDREVHELAAQITPNGPQHRYELLARDIDDATVELLAEARERDRRPLVGVFVVPDEQRVNPAGRLATNLVGRTDIDENGLTGIEADFDVLMRGSDGSETFERGRFGSITAGERVVQPAEVGSDVVLTIDHRLQYVVDQALIEHCESVSANGASAAISDPRTGEILALSSVVRDEDGRCRVPGANRALIDTFEPGSVLKLATMAAAVEQLGIGADTEMPLPSSITVADKVFRDPHPLGEGSYPLWKLFAESSNVGTIGLARQLGPETLHAYFDAFGFGRPTGLGLSTESSGRLRPPGDWWGSDIGSISIGQGVTVTIVQLLAAYNAIANDGVYVAPTLVRAVVDASGEQVLDRQPALRIVEERTARELTAMLTAVVDEGTGDAAAIPGYQVAGKTGTAWKAVPDANGVLRYQNELGQRHYVVTFAGFVPADEPQLSMVVMVDEPRTEYTASVVAAPVFSRIASYALRILGIPPTDVAAVPVELVRGTAAGETEP
jgi:cell division protein FtsI (penicillin-binding protein 3)